MYFGKPVYIRDQKSRIDSHISCGDIPEETGKANMIRLVYNVQDEVVVHIHYIHQD